ncbi:MAG: hypothetical protein WKF43_10170 [Acidimicrobiales bacterium]
MSETSPRTRTRSRALLAPAVGLALFTSVLVGGVSLASDATGADSPQAVLAPSAPPNASDEWPVTECGTASGTGCAPTSRRVDLRRPRFSKPTTITNPLFPVSGLDSVVQTGIVDGKPFRSETTTLAHTGVVDWYGTKVPVVLSQYTAYLDGRITEVAIDRYAQADDGSVWYFGEDVIDYEDGVAFLTEGTWLAGRDGPPAMVMPARPKVGDVFRVENITGIVFEELTVTKVNQTLDGPNGRVRGAIVVDELGVGGGHSEKTLAPGYGEFLTTNDTEIEAVAVAIPTNSLPGGAPLEIRKILTAAWGTLEYGRAEDWEQATFSVDRIGAQFDRLRKTQQPPRVVESMTVALRALRAAVGGEDVRATEQRSIDVAQAAIDLEARYLPAQAIEVARFHLHTQQLRVHAAADDLGGTTGEVATLEWIRDRLNANLPSKGRAELGNALRALRTAVDSENLLTAADHATRLASLLRDLTAG